MSKQQLEKPTDCADVREEAEKIPATENKLENGVVLEISGEQAVRELNRKKEEVAYPPPSEGSITIGEALEAAVLTAGNKPVEWSDAAAIQAAEVRATGRTNIMPGGVAASAQSAATGASSKLPSDKLVTRKDAEGVTGAEMRNDPHLTTYPTGVAASVAAAARINKAK